MYKRSFSGSYLLCIHPEASELLIEEYMKRFVEATQEVDPCLTEPLHKDIGSRTCRIKHKNMRRSVTSVKDLP